MEILFFFFSLFFASLICTFFFSHCSMRATLSSVWQKIAQELNEPPENQMIYCRKQKKNPERQGLETMFRPVWQLFPFYSHNRGKVRPGDNSFERAAWNSKQGKTYAHIWCGHQIPCKKRPLPLLAKRQQGTIGNILLELAKMLSKCCSRKVNSLQSTGRPEPRKGS